MRRAYFLLLIIFCACFVVPANARAHKSVHNTTITKLSLQFNKVIHYGGGDSITHHKRKRKLIAALIALPFGVFGLHRVYLGTSGAVPFLYIASIGGAFGILPFVDFMLIILCKDVNVYADNPAIFMWSRRKHKTDSSGDPPNK